MGGGLDVALVTAMAALIGVPLLLVIWGVTVNNQLVNLQNLIRESWSNVGTELRRRYDLIPNLTATVKGYAAHEQKIFETVTAAREKALSAFESLPAAAAGAQAQSENQLVGSLRQLLAVSEAYPDLKASENFLHLQRELVNTEDRIQAARRFFNGNVRDYNNLVQGFPSSAVASMRGYETHGYYEIDEVVTQPVRAQFQPQH